MNTFYGYLSSYGTKIANVYTRMIKLRVQISYTLSDKYILKEPL